jgi:serine/threonine protein kinase
VHGLPDIPGLRITGELGSGGFGIVYRARQLQIDRDVAVKLDNRILNTEAERQKFLREARAAARLSGHPNVVSVYDAGVARDGRPYIVMELCSRGSLADLLDQYGPLPMEQVVDVALRLADALGHAHAAGVLHRDIKPGNVLIDSFGAVKLADFGLAAILDAQESTITLGALSPSYAAPEAFAWSAPTPAADVYSLAATIYKLATGRAPRAVPWPATSLDALTNALRSEVEPIAGAPQQVNAALIRALASDSAARTPSSRLFAEELRGAAPVPPPPPPPPSPERKPRQKWPVPVAIVTVAVLAAVALYVFVIKNPGPPDASGPSPSTSSSSSTSAPAEALPPKLKACGSVYCLTATTCFRGLNINAGKAAVAGDATCEGEHVWEAFSGGWLPEDAMSRGQAAIEELPEVTKVCTVAVLRTRVAPGVTTADWDIGVLPKVDRGRPYFYCLGTPDDDVLEHSGPSFSTG